MCEHKCEEHEAQIQSLERENARLRREKEELERRLRAYENPHVPSSKQIVKTKVVEVPRELKKRGAPVGHEGATWKREKPTQILYHEKPDKCKHCKSKKIRITEREKTVFDIEIIRHVKEIHYYEYTCNDCGRHFETTSPDLPKEGIFGPNITSLWASMHYIGTIPFDRLSKLSKDSFKTPITPAGLHNVIYRTANIFEPCYKRIMRRIKNSEYVGSDETRYSGWLWDLSTQRDVLVLMRDSRGAGVLDDVLGDYYDGILNSDCFGAYERYKAREYQKDWAHLLRDARDLAKHSEEGSILHKKLLRMYGYITKVKENRDENTLKVKCWIRRQKRMIKSWAKKDYESKAVFNVVRRICKYIDDWFTCLRYDFVEPTNNAREREIRKEVIARKISGCHRSTNGKHAREVMMSTILTAEKRDQNPFDVISEGIGKFNLSQVGS